MVAIYSSNGLGLNLSSMLTLGSRGVLGSATQGRNGERAYVNAATGNLVLQDQDALLAGLGPDVNALRTYNSQGGYDFDGNADGWHGAVTRAVRDVGGGKLERLDLDGSVTVYTFDAGRNLYAAPVAPGTAGDTIVRNANGTYTWTDGATGTRETYQAGTVGLITSMVDTSGNSLTFEYDANNLLRKVTSADGESVNYTYGGTNGRNLVAVSTTLSDGTVLSQVSYTYDAQNRLTGVSVTVNRPGEASKTYTTTYAYDGTSNRVARVDQTDGTSLVFTYVLVAGSYRVATVTDGLGKVTSFAYDTVNNKTTVTDPLGVSTICTYDAKGQLTKVQLGVVAGNPNGVSQQSYTYDANGNVTKITDGANRSVTYGYDAAGNQTSQVDDLGNAVAKTYDARNQLVTETAYAAGGQTVPLTTRYVYDAAGKNLARFVLSAEGRVTEYRYDVKGQRVAEIEYTGGAYDVSGLAVGAVPTEAQLVAWIAAQDKTKTGRTDYVFDFRGQLQTSTTYASVDGTGAGVATGKSTTQYVYNHRGELLQTITPDGRGVTQMKYDGLGRVDFSEARSADGAVSIQTVTLYDDANGKTTVTYANGLSTVSVYDHAGRLVSVAESALGTTLGTTTYRYDGAGRLVMTEDPTGRRSFVIYDGAGRKVGEVSATGGLTEYVYDASDRVTETIAYKTAANLALLVDGSGNPLNPALSSIRPTANALDQKAWTLYDGAGRVKYQVDALGYVTETQYDGASRVTATVKYATAVSTAALGNGQGVSITPVANASDRAATTIYDRDGLVRATIDGEGYLTELRYDANGRLVQTVRYAAKVPGFTNAASIAAAVATARSSGSLAGLIPTASADDITAWVYYDAKGQKVAEVDGEGYLTEYVYDANGKVTRESRYGNKAAGTVNASATLATLRPAANAEDQVSQTTYDALGRVATSTNAEGTVTEYAYDVMGRVVRTTAALGTSEVRVGLVKYDVQGRVVAELSAEGASKITGSSTQAEIDSIWAQYAVKHAYDAAGRKVSSTDQNGNRTVYFYDDASRVRFTVNALGEVAETSYDALGHLTGTNRYATRLSTATTAALVGGVLSGTANAAAVTALAAAKAAASSQNETVNLAYDARGLVASTTDVRGGGSVNTYDAFGAVVSAQRKLTSSIFATSTKVYDRRGLETSGVDDVGGVNASHSNVYDAFGRVISSVNGVGASSQAAYDRLGRVVRKTDPLNANRYTTYDAFGRVLTERDALGNTTTYAYNTATRSVTVTTPENVTVTTVHNRHGQTLTVTDGNGIVTSYQYDANGAQTKVTKAGVVQGETTYDRAGRVYETKDANGTVSARYTYDAASRVLQRIVDPGGLNLITAYEYDAKGREIKVTDPAGIVTTTQYNAKGEVEKRIVDPAGLNLETVYTYDLASRTLTVQSPGGTVTQYVYDRLDRRTQTIVDPTGLALTETYEYDAVGNAVAKTDPRGNVTRYVYDALNRLVYTVDAAGGVQKNEYDAEGRVTKTIVYGKAIDLTGLGTKVTAAQVEAKLLAADTGYPNVVSYRVYDKDGRATYAVDGVGGVTKYTYDKNGNVTEQVTYTNKINLASWTPGTAPAVVADAAKDVRVRTVYDAFNRAVYTIDGVGAVVRQQYDNNGNVIDRVAYATAVPTSTAATSSALAAAVALVANGAKDQHVRNVYDKAGRLTYAADGTGAVTQRVYDADGRVVKEVQYATAVSSATAPSAVTSSASDRVTLSAYDKGGRLTHQVDTLGRVTQSVYDKNGNVTQQIAYAVTIAAPTAATDPAGLVASITTAVTSGEKHVTRTAYDAANRAVYGIDTLGGVVETKYDAAGNVIATKAYAQAITAANLAALSSTATPAQVLAVLTAGTNDRVTLAAYDAANRRVYTVSALGYVAKTEYDGAGRVSLATQYTNPVSGLAIGASAATIASAVATNPVGATGKTTYDAAGHVLGATDALGKTEAYAYDGVGRKLSVTDRNNVVATGYTYDAASRLVSVKDALDGTESYEYDALGNKVSYTNKLGKKARYAYDAAGRQTYTVDPLGAVTQTVYDTLGNVTKQVAYLTTIGATAAPSSVVANANDRVSVSSFDRAGRQVYSVDTVGRATKQEYDAYGNVSQQIAYGTNVATPGTSSDPAAIIANITSTVTSGAKQVTGFAYDALNRRTMTTDALGNRVETRYDVFGHVTGTIAYAGSLGGTDRTTVLAYDADGRRVYTVDALGYVTKSTYDFAGRVLTTTQYANAVSGLAIGASAATIASAVATNPVGATETTTYDAAGRVVGTTDALGKSESSTYDAVGNKLTATDRNNAVTTYTYDVLGRLVSVKDALNGTESYTYDAAGNRLSLTNKVGAKTQYRYDAAGRQEYTLDALGGVTRVWYDALGNVVKRAAYAIRIATTAEPSTVTSSGDDRVTLQAYDRAGRLTASVDALGAATKQEYDAYGNASKVTAFATRIARPTAATSPTFTLPAADAQNDRITRTTYDLLNRQVYAIDALGDVVETRYDAFGKVKATIAYATPVTGSGTTPTPSANDRTTIHAYDAGGRCVYTVDALGYATKNVYDFAGRAKETTKYAAKITGLTTASDVAVIEPKVAAVANAAKDQKTTNVYDAAGRLTSTTDALGFTESYTYDAVGNKKTFTNKKGAVWTYDYDALGRLVTETAPSVEVLSVSVNATTGDLQASSLGSKALITKMQYDALGNVRFRTEAFGIAGQERTTEYVYDALGHQVLTKYPPVGVYSEADTAIEANGATTLAGRVETSQQLTSEVFFNAFGEAYAARDVSGNVSFKVYDAAGRVAYEVDALKYVTKHERNAFGDAEKLTRFEKLQVTATTSAPPTLATMDSAAATAAADATAKNRTIETKYDALGRATTVTQPKGWVNDGLGGVGYESQGQTVTEYDAFGQTVKVHQLARGTVAAPQLWATTTRVFDALGRETMVIDALGYVTRREFDAVGNLVKETQYAKALTGTTVNGKTTYTPATPTTSLDDRAMAYAYDRLNQKVSETVGAARVGETTEVGVEYSTAPDGGATTRSSLTTTYGYDAVGNLTRTTDPLNASTYTYYDVLGRTLAVAAPGRTSTVDGSTLVPLVVFGRDAHGNVISKREYAKTATSVVEQGVTQSGVKPTVVSDNAADRLTVTQYDLAGHATQTTQAVDATKNVSQLISYDAAGHVAKQWQKVTSLGGAVSTKYTVFRYDALGRQTKILTPGTNAEFSTDNATAGTSVVETVYNAFGEATKRGTYLLGQTAAYQETYEYDAAGRVWRTNSEDGQTKIQIYDLLGNQTVQLSSAGSLGSATDKGEDLSSSSYAKAQDADVGTGDAKYARIRRVDFERDLLGRVKKETQPLRTSGGETYRSAVWKEYDRWGNVTRQSAPTRSDAVNRFYTEFKYNFANQLTRQIQPNYSAQNTDAAGNPLADAPTTYIYYDQGGRQIAVKDANGNVNGQVWDAAGQLVREIHADAGLDIYGGRVGEVTYAYDAFGNKVQASDALRNLTDYEYDRLGRNTKVKSPEVMVYTSNSSYVLSAGEKKRLETTTQYDEAGRKIKETNAAGEATEYAYDLRDNLIQTKLFGAVKGETAFDLFGRSVAERNPLGEVTRSTYYDSGLWNGLLKTQVDLAGSQKTLEYDHARQLIKKTGTEGANVGLGGQDLRYAYDGAGQLVQIQDLSEQHHPLDTDQGQKATYTYDEAGRRVKEVQVDQNAAGQETVQDQTLLYDWLGRLKKVTSPIRDLSIQYEYDKVGNRTKQVSSFIETEQKTVTDIYGGVTIIPAVIHNETLYYAFDSMNRQILVDGAKALGTAPIEQILTKESGAHLLAYDANGNRISDKSYGTMVVARTDSYGGFIGASKREGLETEFYSYDATGRLEKVLAGTFDENWVEQGRAQALLLDTRQYDAASRLLKMGANFDIPKAYMSAIAANDPNANGLYTRVSWYDKGLVQGQKTYKSDGTDDGKYDSETVYTYKKIVDVPDYYGGQIVGYHKGFGDAVYGYDAAGNVLGYTSRRAGQSETYYETLSFAKFDSYKEGVTQGVRADNVNHPGTMTNKYDANGYLIGLDDSTKNQFDRTFANDAAGRVIRKIQQGRVLWQPIANGNALAIYGEGTDPNKPTNNEGDPNYKKQNDFNLGFSAITANYPSAAIGQYVVQAGDTFESIAERVYNGDKAGAADIARANPVTAKGKALTTGLIINLPTRLAGSTNNASTFKPYDPSKVIGDTSPNVPQPSPKSCGIIGTIIIAVIVTIATVYTAGAAAIAMTSGVSFSTASFGTVMSMGAAALAGGGGAVGFAAAGIGAFVGGSLGELMNAGVTGKFSMNSVLSNVVSTWASMGVGSVVNTGNLKGIAKLAVNAAKSSVTNALTQGATLALGISEEKGFDWMGVAGAATGSAVGSLAGEALGVVGKNPLKDFGWSRKLLNGTLAGLASGVTVTAMRGGKVEVWRAMADSFGNALGNTFVEGLSGTGTAGPPGDAYYEPVSSEGPPGDAYYEPMSSASPPSDAGSESSSEIAPPVSQSANLPSQTLASFLGDTSRGVLPGGAGTTSATGILLGRIEAGDGSFIGALRRMNLSDDQIYAAVGQMKAAGKDPNVVRVGDEFSVDVLDLGRVGEGRQNVSDNSWRKRERELERWSKDASADVAALPDDRARTPWRSPVRADVVKPFEPGSPEHILSIRSVVVESGWNPKKSLTSEAITKMTDGLVELGMQVRPGARGHLEDALYMSLFGISQDVNLHLSGKLNMDNWLENSALSARIAWGAIGAEAVAAMGPQDSMEAGAMVNLGPRGPRRGVGPGPDVDGSQGDGDSGPSFRPRRQPDADDAGGSPTPRRRQGVDNDSEESGDAPGVGRSRRVPKRFTNVDAFNRAANKAEPNASYSYDGYTWETDGRGRVKSAEGPVKLKAIDGRKGTDGVGTQQIGKGPDAQPGDVGFHLVGDQFGGPTNRLNVVPGNGVPANGLKNLNQGKYARWESRVKNLAQNPGNTVDVRVEPVYNRANLTARPDAFKASYRVNGGGWVTEVFRNRPGG